jgi:hypothetical protein
MSATPTVEFPIPPLASLRAEVRHAGGDTGLSFRGPWDNSGYRVGDIVSGDWSFGAYPLAACIADEEAGTGTDPFGDGGDSNFARPGPVVNNGAVPWDPNADLNPQLSEPPVYKSAILIGVDETGGYLYIFEGSIYVCIVGHVASQDRNPRARPDLWQLVARAA